MSLISGCGIGPGTKVSWFGGWFGARRAPNPPSGVCNTPNGDWLAVAGFDQFDGDVKAPHCFEFTGCEPLGVGPVFGGHDYGLAFVVCFVFHVGICNLYRGKLARLGGGPCLVNLSHHQTGSRISQRHLLRLKWEVALV